jgi:UDP-2,3-diacylglucosamine pyrophosphatase LpxH
VILLVISDLHLGRGKYFKNGQLNILEDFFEDGRFYEFLDYYSSESYYWEGVHLVLNGDIFNLIQVDLDGIFNHVVDGESVCAALDRILQGHPLFFNAIKTFLSRPNKKISYVIGNHDIGMSFQEAQHHLDDILGHKLDYSFEWEQHGVYIEHGHKYEAINMVPENRLFMDGPNGKTILNLPWGTLFCILALPKLKKDRPYLDKVRPIKAYMKWCLFHDFAFFLKMALVVAAHIVQTSFSQYTKQNRNFKTSIKLLKQVTIYPKYGKIAKRIFRKRPHLHTVIIGHTHLYEWRKFRGNRYYFNTGTWNPIPSIDAGLHESVARLNYTILELHSKSGTIRSAALNTWQGTWKPFKEEVWTDFT